MTDFGTNTLTGEPRRKEKTGRHSNAYHDYVIEQSEPWLRKRVECLREHGRICFGCKANEADIQGALQIHHVHYLTLTYEDPKEDLMPLCKECHDGEEVLRRARDSVRNRYGRAAAWMEGGRGPGWQKHCTMAQAWALFEAWAIREGVSI